MRTTFRTVAVTTGAVAALALPAGAAYADSPSAPLKEADGRAASTSDAGEGKVKQRVFVKEWKLVGGFTAKVYKPAPGKGYEADMIAQGKVMDTLRADGTKAAHGEHNGAHFVLNPDGTMKSWVEGAAKKPADKPADKPVEKKAERTTATPKGGVKAGAEGVVSDTDSTALIAGGAGLAAVGAAGLGFAVLRRGRTES